MFSGGSHPAITAPPAIIPQWEQVVSDETPAPRLAIDLNTVKDFLNIPQEDNFFNAEKTAMALVAQSAIERYCQMDLLRSTWIGKLPQFFDHIRITKRPFYAVTKIEYVAAVSGEILTVDPSLYVAGRIAQLNGNVTLGDGCSWPNAASRWDGVRITVQAGFGSQTAIPYDIQQALLITIASIDHSRADGGAQSAAPRSVYAMKNPQASAIIPPEARALLAPYVLKTLGL